MTRIWRTFTTTLPDVSGYEIIKGYMLNGVLSIDYVAGSVYVSKIYSDTGKTFYVENNAIAPYIINGIYTPPTSLGDFLVTENGDFLVTENGDKLII